MSGNCEWNTGELNTNTSDACVVSSGAQKFLWVEGSFGDSATSAKTILFFVDSAFADVRFDRAVVLILITALLNIAVDLASRAIRARLRLRTSFDSI